MTSSSPESSKKRANKPEPDSSAISDSASPSSETPSKRPRSTPTKASSKTLKSPTKQEGWTPELRLKLFEAYEASSQVKWDDVAKKMGNGKNAQACREQWQRATGKRIKAALAEKN